MMMVISTNHNVRPKYDASGVSYKIMHLRGIELGILKYNNIVRMVQDIQQYMRDCWKQYYERKKDKMKEQRQQTFHCEACDATYKNSTRLSHNRTITHWNNVKKMEEEEQLGNISK